MTSRSRKGHSTASEGKGRLRSGKRLASRSQLQTNERKGDNLREKRRNAGNRHFTKEDIQRVGKDVEKCSTSYQGKAHGKSQRFPTYTPTSGTHMQLLDRVRGWQRFSTTRTFLYNWGRCVNWCNRFGHSLVIAGEAKLAYALWLNNLSPVLAQPK